MLAVAEFQRSAWFDTRPLERIASTTERAFIESHLSPTQRMLIALRLDQGLNHIEIANEPGYSSPKVAEQTWARISALARRISRDRGRKKTGRPPKSLASGSEPAPAPEAMGAAVTLPPGQLKRGSQSSSGKAPSAAGAAAPARQTVAKHPRRADAMPGGRKSRPSGGSPSSPPVP